MSLRAHIDVDPISALEKSVVRHRQRQATIRLDREPRTGRGGHPSQRVGGAHEFQNEGGLGVGIDCLGRADLKYFAVAHDRDPVGDGEGLALVVGDDDGGDAELTQQDRQLYLHLFPQILVERAQRLVQQQHHRPDGKRPGDSDALLLPAAQLRRVAVL